MHFQIPANFVSATAALIVLGACSRQPANPVHRWFGMDTDFSATLYGSPVESAAPADSAFALLERESARLEQVFSDYLPGSSLSLLQGRTGDTLEAGPELLEVFRAAAEMAAASGGSFDITLHDLKEVWGLSSGDSNRVPPPEAIAEAMRGNPAFHPAHDYAAADRPPFRILGDGRLVLLRDSAVFDLGGIAKGYTVDRLHRILDSLGHPNHILTAGGDLRVGGSKGEKPWVLGIRHPRRPDAIAGTLTLSEPMATSTSGDYERYFIRDGIRYHHIFDPSTGEPARPYASVTVLASGSMLADRLTKPLFILGPEKSAELLRRFGARAVWMRESASEGDGLCHEASPGLEGIMDLPDVPPCP